MYTQVLVRPLMTVELSAPFLHTGNVEAIAESCPKSVYILTLYFNSLIEQIK